MKPVTLMSLGATAAIAGGALRVFTALFTHVETTPFLEFLYFLIDILLLFGLIAIAAGWVSRLNPVSLIMFAIAFIGLASLVGPETVINGVDYYMIGASVLSVGLVGFSMTVFHIVALRRAAYFWTASFVSGVFSTLSGNPQAFLIAGALFGLGFVAAGVATLEMLDEQMPLESKKAP